MLVLTNRDLIVFLEGKCSRIGGKICLLTHHLNLIYRLNFDYTVVDMYAFFFSAF